jgi:CRISPR/Cas system CSM-associated protein Csm5 (group 7 of RAMP superfamily)
LIECKYPYRFINTSIPFPFISGYDTLEDYYSKEDLAKIAEYGKTRDDLIKENKELKEIINKLNSELNDLIIENYSLRKNIN